jgi:hypothetical protein
MTPPMTNKVPATLPNTTAFHLGSSAVCAKPIYFVKPPVGRVAAPDPTGAYTMAFPRLPDEATCGQRAGISAPQLPKPSAGPIPQGVFVFVKPYRDATNCVRDGG